MGADVDRIRREIALSDVAAQHGVELSKDGDEWIACCPFHAERTPSFTIFPGKDKVDRFFCFGCGEKGDVLDFVQKIKNVPLPVAIDILGGKGGDRPNIAPRKVEVRDPYAGIVPLDPPAAPIEVGKRVRLYNPKRAGAGNGREWGSFAPSLVHPYRRADGSLYGYALRHDYVQDGKPKKETPAVLWVRLPDGKETWCRFPFPRPRPLYGLDRLGDARQVIVVEGEKCADALDRATGRVVISWAGGTQNVKHADWSPLAGRNVIIWPDNDKPGFQTRDEIGAILSDLGCKVRALEIPEDKPHAWDAADAVDHDGWGKDDIDGFMKGAVRPWVKPAEPEPEPEPEPAPKPAPSNVVAMPVREARTVQQEVPATIVDMDTGEELPNPDAPWFTRFITNDKGAKKPGLAANWTLLLENHPDMAGVIRFDEFKMRVMLMRAPPWDRGRSHWEPRPVIDRDFQEAAMWLEARHMTPKPPALVGVFDAIGRRAAFDSLIDYLDPLVWDGQKRAETWLSYYLGVDDGPYSRAVGKRWLISSVARGLNPGCKMDTMPIMEGAQGLLKSSATQTLYGKQFFTDNLSDIGSKDAKIDLQGTWVVEIAEMQRFNAAETNEVKKFLSQQVDRFRPPYGRTTIDAPRRCVMVGTINPEGNAYLRDPTGARRFWPISVRSIDLEGIAADRDQLWAEAVAYYRQGVPWWVQEDEVEAVVAEQEKRTDVDPWADAIAPKLAVSKTITQAEILAALNIPAKDADHRHAARIGRVMKKLGWEARRERRGGKSNLVFVSSENQGELL